MSTDKADATEIIIIDDDKSVLQVLSKILQKAGYGVDVAETGHEALDKLQTHAYAIALLDVRLQDTSGLDLLTKMRDIAPNMTRIMLTGYPSEEDRIRAMQQGADDYLAKPIKSEKLIELVDTKLRRSRKQPQEMESLQNTNH